MRIKGYKVETLLGKGGMALVYIATQESLARQVALKILNPELNSEQVHRFIDEGRIIASLKHPNIVTVYDVGSTGHLNYIAMEYLEGGDLESRIGPSMNKWSALQIIKKISQALYLVHKSGIIHGDVKPGNILFRVDNTPVLTDFGISRRKDSQSTVNNGLYASPLYASPELLQGHEIDQRTDIYSLGIVMYELLTGKRPFSGENEMEAIANSIRLPAPDLPASLKSLQPLLNHMLAKDKEQRISDARQVAKYIDKYIADNGVVAAAAVEDTQLIDSEVIVDYVSKQKSTTKFRQIRETLLLLMLLIALSGYFWQPLKNNYIDRFWLTDPVDQAAISTKNQQAQDKVFTSDTTVDKELQQQISVQETEDESTVKENVFIDEKFMRSLDDSSISDEQQISVTSAEEDVIQKAEESYLQVQDEKQKKKEEINRLLVKAKERLKQYKLTTPLNDNAIYYYQKVLELDSTNKQAEEGLELVVRRYENLARQQIAEYEYDKAQEYIQRGLTIKPEDESLLTLKKEANIRHEPKRVYRKVKDFIQNF